MADNKTIAKNTIFLYIRMFLIMGVSLFTSRVVLKTLGVEDFGLYGVVGGIVTMFSFLNGSLGGATSRFITFELGKRNFVQLNKIFSVAFFTHVFIALLIVLLAETVGLWFFYEKMTIAEDRISAAFWVLQISILNCVFSMTQVPYNADIIAHENMKVYAYVGVIEVLLKLGVVYLLSISPIDKLIFYALLLFLIQLGTMLYYRWFCMNNYKESHLIICREVKLYKNMFSYAGSDLIGNISVLAQGQGLNLLLNVFFGPAVNAARTIAYQIQGAVTQFSNNFMTAVKPQIIKSYAEGDEKAMWSLVNLSSCFSFYLMLLICLPIMLESHYILRLWLGDFPEHSTTFAVLVMVLCLIQTLKTPRTSVLHATGKLLLANIVVGGLLCFAFPLAYIFLRTGMAPESVFWAAIITMLLSEFVSVFILRRYIIYKISDYLLKVHVRCTLVTFISVIAPMLLFDRFMPPSFLRLIITCILTTLSVSITALFIGMDKGMRVKLINIVKTKILHKNDRE